MKKNIRKGQIVLIVLLLLFTTSCDIIDLFSDTDSDDDSLALIGTWTSSSEKIVVTEDSFYNYYGSEDAWTLYYTGTIENYENNALNADSTTTYSDGYGYITVLYDGGSGDGQYGVIRWEDLTTTDGTTTISYSAGYYDDDDTDLDWSGTYYDTADEAEIGMDDTYFSWYSSLTKQ